MADDLKGILFGGKPKKEPEHDAESEDVGPCGWVWVKGCKAIDIERGGKPVVSLQYVYLSVRSEFTPTKFWMVFVGLESWKVTIEGRNLRPLFDRMNDHCLRKIRKVDRDMFPDDGKPVVTGLELDDVTPKD